MVTHAAAPAPTLRVEAFPGTRTARIPATPSSPAAPDPASIERRLAARIGAGRYRLWFAEPATLSCTPDTLEVQLTTRYAAEWVERNFRTDLEAVAREAGAGRVEIGVLPAAELAAPPAPAEPAPAVRRPRAAGRRTDESGTQHWHRFDDFVVGDSNRVAFEAARRLAEDSLGGIRSILLHGGCGVGKTHLLQSLCCARRAQFPREQVRYTTGEQFTNDYIQSVRNGTIEAFRARVRKLDLLAIDDVHFLSNKGATQVEFLHTIDAIGLAGARVAIATDAHPRALRSFSEALVSRMLAGMVVQMEAPDRGTRDALVARLATARGLPLEPAAARAIADRAIGSVREIEGALARVAAAMLLEDTAGPATLTLVERALGVGESAVRGAPPRIGDIVDAACEALGVARDDLAATGRHRRVVLARGIVVHLAREMTTLSFPEIARHLGRTAHSSAHAAARRVQRMLEVGEELPTEEGASGPRSVRELVETVRRSAERRSRTSR
ncbi:MAG: DnaA/Hda family protein [Phycisphaerales bacterium]